jgi:S-formylglutathione hydrolase
LGVQERTLMSWRLVEIAGKTADLWEPPARTGAAGRALVFLHGYDSLTLSGNEAWTAALGRHGLPCLCPHGPGCWWLDRIYPPFDAAVTPLEFLHGPVREFAVQWWNLPPRMLALSGFEMGGQGALQLAYRHGRDYPVVAAVSPKLDLETWHGHGLTLDEIFPDREAARQAGAMLRVSPLDWPKSQFLACDPADPYCFEATERLVGKLGSSGIPCDRELAVSQGGFGWEYVNCMAERVVKFVVESLERESRRLV